MDRTGTETMTSTGGLLQSAFALLSFLCDSHIYTVQ